jgi:hypothetical protein
MPVQEIINSEGRLAGSVCSSLRAARITSLFVLDCPWEFFGHRERAFGARCLTMPIAERVNVGLLLSFIDRAEEPVGSFRRSPLSFLGDPWRGDISIFISIELSGICR